MGRKHHVLHGRSRYPWEGGILVDRGAHCKVLVLSVVSCANTAEPIHLPFRLWTRVGRRMHKFNRQCALMEGHVAVSCRITLNHPSTAAMRLTANYFDHLLSLDTSHRLLSASSRVLYCGHFTQYIHLVFSLFLLCFVRQNYSIKSLLLSGENRS